MADLLFFIWCLLWIVGGIVLTQYRPQPKATVDKWGEERVTEPDFKGVHAKILGATFIAVNVVIAVLLCVSVVPARSVGVQVSFGKTKDTLGPGLHLIAPWTDVKKFTSTIQTTRLQGDGNGADDDGPCVTVRLGNQTTACVNVTAQWSVSTTNKEGVQQLYARWRSFDNIEPSLFRPQLQHSLLAPFEDYDPLKVLQANGELATPTASIEAKAREQLELAVGDGIQITGVTINLVNYDQTTQDKLNSYAQAIADTRIAVQRKATADAQRQANDALAGSAASKDPQSSHRTAWI